MKKVFIYVLIALVVLSLLSSFSGYDGDFGFDKLKPSTDSGEDPTSSVTTTVSPSPDGNVGNTYTENVFYYTLNGAKYSTSNISALPEGTRGYFVDNGAAYFCITAKSVSSKKVTINKCADSDVDVFYTTTDMKTLASNDHDDGAVLDGSFLIVYAKFSIWYDLDSTQAQILSTYTPTVVKTDLVPPVFDTFVYYVDGVQKLQNDVTQVSEGTRGYYIGEDVNGNVVTYYCIKSKGSNEHCTYIDECNVSGFTACFKLTKDFVTFADHSFDDGALFYDDYFIVYAYNYGSDGAKANHDKLVSEFNVGLNFHDPGLEGPSD